MAGQSHGIIRRVRANESFARIKVALGSHGYLAVTKAAAGRLAAGDARQSSGLLIEPANAVVWQTGMPGIRTANQGLLQLFGILPTPFGPTRPI